MTDLTPEAYELIGWLATQAEGMTTLDIEQLERLIAAVQVAGADLEYERLSIRWLNSSRHGAVEATYSQVFDRRPKDR